MKEIQNPFYSSQAEKLCNGNCQNIDSVQSKLKHNWLCCLSKLFAVFFKKKSEFVTCVFHCIENKSEKEWMEQKIRIPGRGYLIPVWP